MPLTPPETINKPVARNPRLHIVYGLPKVGKTSACAQIPDAYLLELTGSEGGGADYIEFRGSRLDTLEEFRAAIPQLRAWYKEGRIKRLVVDTIDALEAWLETYFTRQYSGTAAARSSEGKILASIYELGYGKGHAMVKVALKEALADLASCCDELVLIAHIKAGAFDKTEQAVIAKDIDLPGKMSNLVCFAADAIGYFFAPTGRKDERWITYAAKEGDVNCGGRCPHLSGKRFLVSKLVDGRVVADWSQIYIA